MEEKEAAKKVKHFYDKIWVKIIFQIIITIVTLIIVAWWAESFSHTDFEITDYSQSVNTTTYTNITNTVEYNGKGIITTKDKNNSYIVVIEKHLASGGNEDNQDDSYLQIVVSNGKGEFSTYDSGDEGKITKPQYQFKIIGYEKLS